MVTSDGTELGARALAAIKAALESVARNRPASGLDVGTSLVDDLGLDSIRFLDLAVALENALGVVEFPLQEWLDEELTSRAEVRYTVGSLLAFSIRRLDVGAAGPG